VIAGGAVRAVITACGHPQTAHKSDWPPPIPHNVVKADIVALESLRDRNAVPKCAAGGGGSSMVRDDSKSKLVHNPHLHPGKAQENREGLGLRKSNQWWSGRIRPASADGEEDSASAGSSGVGGQTR